MVDRGRQLAGKKKLPTTEKVQLLEKTGAGVKVRVCTVTLFNYRFFTIYNYYGFFSPRSLKIPSPSQVTRTSTSNKIGK